MNKLLLGVFTVCFRWVWFCLISVNCEMLMLSACEFRGNKEQHVNL